MDDFVQQFWYVGVQFNLNEFYILLGLVDEVVVFDELLMVNELQVYVFLASVGIDFGMFFLLYYFSFNEGGGVEVWDVGIVMIGFGVVEGVMFIFLGIWQEEDNCFFILEICIVNLNNSNIVVS